MQRYEYKVIPAPTRGEKARGVKATPDRFALALTNLMNDLGADGWSYVRADALPCEERSGFTGTKTTFQNVLVFSRPLAQAAAPMVSAPVAPQQIAAPVLVADPEPPATVVPAPSVISPEPVTAPTLGAARRDLAAE